MSEMLEIQKYLINSPEANLEAKLEKLKEELGIKSTIYYEDGIFILNYSQVDSPKSHPIVIECRSLILDMYTYGVVSRKFDRFFNHGECPEYYSDFDISRSYTLTKEDGSLIGVYYNSFTSRWEISTRSLAKAEGEHASGGTFREKVLSAFGFNGEDHFQDFSKNKLDNKYTYIFEYCGPSNRVVFRYEKEEMVLTGVRNNSSGNYVTPFIMNTVKNHFNNDGINVRMVTAYPLNSFDDIKNAIDELPTLAEGYVCFDPVSGKHVKCKSPGYVAIHGLRENGILSMKRAYTLVLINDHEEYLQYFPEDKEVFAPVIDYVQKFVRHLEVSWERVSGITDKKEFALAVKDLSGSGIFFEAKKKNQTTVQVFNEMEINKKLRLFW